MALVVSIHLWCNKGNPSMNLKESQSCCHSNSYNAVLWILGSMVYICFHNIDDHDLFVENHKVSLAMRNTKTADISFYLMEQSFQRWICWSTCYILLLAQLHPHALRFLGPVRSRNSDAWGMWRVSASETITVSYWSEDRETSENFSEQIGTNTMPVPWAHMRFPHSH